MKNAGYEIVKIEYYSESYAIVLGMRDKDSWVTWEYNNKSDTYFWGHYYVQKKNALHDYYTRLANNTNPELIPF